MHREEEVTGPLNELRFQVEQECSKYLMDMQQDIVQVLTITYYMYISFDLRSTVLIVSQYTVSSFLRVYVP